MERFEAQVEKQLGKLLHQKRINLRTLLMVRLRSFLEETVQVEGSI
ncbi:hypothetical protein [Deinococcus roseus]|uniref:Uncharacterized protein n=1 Tax=Deinococcus roseus TaxID=392414 RepID=A0ABQ2DFI0_9DEIO|nr:hypothetical protein [Deinococcus roseus]GGJ55530.1 hypothetical protein GCM10008938_47120 [Deinococcus roseus]